MVIKIDGENCEVDVAIVHTHPELEKEIKELRKSIDRITPILIDLLRSKK